MGETRNCCRCVCVCVVSPIPVRAHSLRGRRHHGRVWQAHCRHRRRGELHTRWSAGPTRCPLKSFVRRADPSLAATQNRTPSRASSWPVSATEQRKARTSWSSSPVRSRRPQQTPCTLSAAGPLTFGIPPLILPSEDTEISLIEETFKNFTERSDIGIILINQFVSGRGLPVAAVLPSSVPLSHRSAPPFCMADRERHPRPPPRLQQARPHDTRNSFQREPVRL